ncbi:MAG: hypothetical protein E6J34_07920 [Chloroflexi bacterium]|nr:MAG: hypothetical protein E6J34_07920 [Chloroflexota bacterium]
MGKHFAWKITAGTTVKLKDYNPDFAEDKIKRDEGESALQLLTKELSELQERLYEAHQQSVLVVLQGMDTSGKDGTIRHVLANVNPQSCYVQSFKEPTEQELAHDFLWRVHKATPTQCNEIPWYLVPANHKWYRNLAVAHTLVTTMSKYKDEWEAQLQARGKQELEKLRQLGIQIESS